GDCAADEDADGICDDVDDCVGSYDACGVCNGPGEIYECGCSDIPAGDCDCDGNQLDALGVCGGDCAADADGNGVCDDDEVSGCMDSCACNYDSNATQNDESCEFETCSGCIYPMATNYNPDATIDNGSCTFEGCSDEDFLNFNSYANVNAGCSDIPSSVDMDNSGVNNATDLLDFFQYYSSYVTCSESTITEDMMNGNCQACCEISGCGYPNALNYDENASLDAGVCLFAGCTDESATNYNDLANVDDGSCIFSVCADFDGDGFVDVNDFLLFLLGYVGENIDQTGEDNPCEDPNDPDCAGGGMEVLIIDED
ncbi:MAG: hypothetical protein O3C18_02060, partial [Bacteroidetes bacterium]|nr:hypothetical protein [Bacteroidota bacterium]